VNATAALLLGPMLRYVSETEATVWVETDRECEVEILGRRAMTFEVAGHHYGLVIIEGLAPGSEHEYQVALDGAVRWPLAAGGFPPSVLRTLSRDRPARLAFGSCRVAQIAPANLDAKARRRRAAGTSRANDEGTDALAATATALAASPRDRWPDVLLMIGDQVYADEPGPATRRFIAAHRAGRAASAAAGPPGGEVADFAEYCALYQEAWSDRAVRWLFSVIPTSMIFDDHDVHDDWNISGAWRRDFATRPWWRERIQSAYQSYWVYQHLGNLSPAGLASDETWAKVRQPGDAAAVLAGLADRADQRAPGIRWSVRRSFGRVRVVMLDSRSRRVVDGGPRLMADEGEWRWLTESVAGDWEHVVIATSVPPLLPRGIHTLEAWTERICGGAWGRRAARFGERLRRDFDLEHWPAFGASFAGLEQLLTGLASGRLSTHGEPPVSVTLISGDIHHSYLAAVDLPPAKAKAGRAAADGADGTTGPPGATRTSVVYEAVCSPFHQALPPKMRYAQRLARTRASGLVGTAVAALAGARVPVISWRVIAGPWFANMIATLEFDGPAASIRFDQAVNGADGLPGLDPAADSRLSPPPLS
jgi:PhoD-like phosphatase